MTPRNTCSDASGFASRAERSRFRASRLTSPNARLLEPIHVRIHTSLMEDQFRRPSVRTRNKRHLNL